MPRVCAITKKKTVFGHNVSKANNKTRRKIKPNIAKKRIWVESKGRYVRLKISHNGQRTLDKNGTEETLQKLGII